MSVAERPEFAERMTGNDDYAQSGYRQQCSRQQPTQLVKSQMQILHNWISSPIMVTRKKATRASPQLSKIKSQSASREAQLGALSAQSFSANQADLLKKKFLLFSEQPDHLQ